MAVTRRRRAVVVGLITVGLIGAPPAMAVSAQLGKVSLASSSGTWVYNKDLADDGQFTATRYVANGTSGESTLTNKSGANATVSLNAGGTVTSMKACVSRTLQPMYCTRSNTDEKY